jgi:hypothetical protein
MSATGSGKDCKSARINSEINIEKTLKNFLKCYKPHIVKETHTVKTSCERYHDHHHEHCPEPCNDHHHEHCPEPCPPVPPTPEDRDATATIELDYVSDTRLIGDSGFFNTYIRLGQGVGVPNPFLEATFLNLDIYEIIDRPFGVPLITSDFGLNFYPVPVKGTFVYDNDTTKIDFSGYIKPDTFPPLADSALRSGVGIFEGFDQPLWTGRVNLDNLIEVEDANIFSPLVSVSNKFTFSLDNPFLLSKSSKPKVGITTGKAKFEFRVVNVDEGNRPGELK